MTTRTLPALPATIVADRGSRGSRLRRFGTLVRAETTILLRNKTAAFTAIVLPLVIGLAFGGVGIFDPASLGIALTSGLVSMSLLYVIYFTMVTSLVGRREQLVLKRLSAGEATPLEIVLAPAVPLWILLVLQSTLAVAGATLVFSTPVAHPWALALAVIGGAGTWTGLAIWSATWTKTVESAQLTTLPLMLVAIVLSGLMFPLEFTPRAVQHIAHVLPMTPVVDLIQLAYSGVGIDGTTVGGVSDALLAAAGMVVPLAVWTAFGIWTGLRDFRWDPRS
ncbi:ABC transporter permease [Granulicoccus sp. GXG6511]|uniref:ABC transporter permease n=1 Tax=Granulicoccus sp. GXG6511 TaxID=3381351 RepID=UPI003D7D26DD